MADVDHGWQDEVVEAVACIGTFAHDVCLEGNTAREVFFHLVIVSQTEVEEATEREGEEGDEEGEEDGPEDAASRGACPCLRVVLLG